MMDLGIPTKIIRLVRMTMENTRSRVAVEGKLSGAFEVHRGLRQGTIYQHKHQVIAYADDIALLTRSETELITIYQHKHQVIAYADDIALLTRSETELIRITTRVASIAKEYGLYINEDKTKYMCMDGKKSREKTGKPETVINGEKL
ncbi:Reverse transcriptase (RNA-dependent DNA polymerase) [Popillia japonica]|uniref:Reverse transcriptase (RNA-dependent DNA polymerase) n=1 Tax=Popillia japonica TaxID=7064 RepID=A0AAW1LEX8_POPJA